MFKKSCVDLVIGSMTIRVYRAINSPPLVLIPAWYLPKTSWHWKVYPQRDVSQLLKLPPSSARNLNTTKYPFMSYKSSNSQVRVWWIEERNLQVKQLVLETLVYLMFLRPKERNRDASTGIIVWSSLLEWMAWFT
jgi:hypothetical protein